MRGRSCGLDKRGVDRPAKHRGENLRMWARSLDPSKVVRITLFAKLPPPPRAEKWLRKKKAEVISRIKSSEALAGAKLEHYRTP